MDGRLKVTGAAKYAAEFNAPGLLHGHIVSSTIAKGRITRIDASEAPGLPGMVHVFRHENRPNLAWLDRKWKDDDAIHHSLQPVARVVAGSFEVTRFGARLVRALCGSTTNCRGSTSTRPWTSASSRATGVPALDVAMDELACELKMEPL